MELITKQVTVKNPDQEMVGLAYRYFRSGRKELQGFHTGSFEMFHSNETFQVSYMFTSFLDDQD